MLLLWNVKLRNFFRQPDQEAIEDGKCCIELTLWLVCTLKHIKHMQDPVYEMFKMGKTYFEMLHESWYTGVIYQENWKGLRTVTKNMNNLWKRAIFEINLF